MRAFQDRTNCFTRGHSACCSLRWRTWRFATAGPVWAFDIISSWTPNDSDARIAFRSPWQHDRLSTTSAYYTFCLQSNSLFEETGIAPWIWAYGKIQLVLCEIWLCMQSSIPHTSNKEIYAYINWLLLSYQATKLMTNRTAKKDLAYNSIRVMRQAVHYRALRDL